MRMLNYTNDTNPFRRGTTTTNVSTTSHLSPMSYTNKYNSKTYFQDPQWVKRRKERDGNFSIKQMQDHSDSSSKKYFTPRPSIIAQRDDNSVSRLSWKQCTPTIAQRDDNSVSTRLSWKQCPSTTSERDDNSVSGLSWKQRTSTTAKRDDNFVSRLSWTQQPSIVSKRDDGLSAKWSCTQRPSIVSQRNSRQQKGPQPPCFQKANPPSTIFASLKDMDFMDASTLSDDVCSVLSFESSNSVFNENLISTKTTTSLTKLPLHNPRSSTSAHQGLNKIEHRTSQKSFITKNRNGICVSKTEVVTKGKMSGMTLMDALNRRRNIVDADNNVKENLQRPFKSVKRELWGLNTSEGTKHSVRNLKAKRFEPHNRSQGVHDFMLARNQLKKVQSVAIESPHVQPQARAETSSRVSTTSTKNSVKCGGKQKSTTAEEKIAKRNDHIKLFQNSSNASFTTLSTICSQSKSSFSNSSIPTTNTSVVEEEHKNDSENQNEKVVADLSKYNRMLRVGIPTGAVKNAMKKDGVDPSIMVWDNESLAKSVRTIENNEQTKLNNSNSTNNRSESNVSSKISVNEKTFNLSNNLNSDDKTNTEKYSKMLKMGVPLGAIHNAMKRDGIDPSKISVGGNKSPIISLTDMKRPRDRYRRTRVHWDTLKQSQLSDKSIWFAIKEDKDIENLEIDESEFKALFQIKEEINPRRSLVKDIAIENAVKVIDPKRANNGGITLARLKMSSDDIAAAVNVLDISNLNAQQLSGIIEFTPTVQERRALQKYHSEDKDKLLLCECEKFMVSMMSVNDVQRKTQTMLFMLQFPVTINEIRSEVRIKTKACMELVNSICLRKILGIILKIGNRLNRAGVEVTSSADPNSIITDATGFSVESLSKLSQVKACDKKTSFLSYIVSLIRRSNRSLLNVKDEIPHVFQALSINSDHDKSLSSLEKQLLNARLILPAGTVTPNDMPIENEHQQDFWNVQRFVDEASKLLSIVSEENEEAKVKVMSVLEYFSTEKSLSPNALFSFVASFCKEIDAMNSQLLQSKQKKNHFLRYTGINTNHEEGRDNHRPFKAEAKNQNNYGNLPAKE